MENSFNLLFYCSLSLVVAKEMMGKSYVVSLFFPVLDTWASSGFLYTFKKDFIYLFLGRGEGREKEGEKHQCVVASHTPPTRDLAHNPGMCPDWESNRQLFGS